MAAQLGEEGNGGGFVGGIDGDDDDRGGGGGRFGDEHGEPFDAGTPADAGDGGAAHLFDQTIIAPAGEHGALRAEAAGDEFEGGVVVVIEATDDAGIFDIGDAHGGEVGFQRGVKLGGVWREVGRDGGGVGDQGDIIRVFGIEDAERIFFEAEFAVGRELGCVGGEIGDQGGAIGIAAGGVTEGVDVEGDAVADAERMQDGGGAGDGFGIGQGGFGAEDFKADLVKLPVAAFLWAFVAEHWAGIEDFLRQGLGEAVGDQSAADAGGAFGAEGERITAAIREIIHFFGNDVGGFAEIARKDGGGFKNGGGPGFGAVEGGDALGGADDVGVAAGFGADQVLGAARRLELAQGG